MSKRTSILAAILFTMLSGAASAQIETVVATAERRQSEDYGAPYLSLVKRADHVFTQVRVTCDTRTLSQRESELVATLRNMIRTAAGTSTISLGIRQDDLLIELKESNLNQLSEPETRADTSKAYVVVKSAVSDQDAFNDATARIEAFIKKTPKVGRAEILRDGSWDLTIVGPDQYRDRIVAMIVADSKHAAEAFGPGYAVSIEGLERQIMWYQKGPLDLALFIPYHLKIEPAARTAP